MLKMAFKQYKDNWKISIGVFIVLLVSCMLIASTSFLFMSALGYSNNHPGVNIFPVIGLIFGVATFLSIIVIFSTLNLMVKLKADQYGRLRILGFTFHQISSMIYAEAVILLIIPLIVSLIVAKPLGNWYAHLLIKNGLPYKEFNVNDDNGLGYLYILFTLILVFIVLAIAIAPIRKVSMTGGNDVFKNGKGAIACEWIFGILFIAGGVGVACADNPTNIATVLFPDIFFVIGFALIGKYLFGAVISTIKGIWHKTSYFNNSLGETRSNANQNSLLIVMIAMMIMFVMFSTDIFKFQVQSSGGTVGTGANATFGQTFNSVSILLTVVISGFSIAVAFNTLLIYFIQKDRDYDNLRVLGYTRWDVFKQTIYQALILAFGGIVLGVIPAIGLNLGYSITHDLGTIAVKNIGSFVGMVLGIPVGFVLIGTTITGLQMAMRKIR